MRRRIYFTIFALAVLILALLGWTVDGLRWAAAAPRRARPRKLQPSF